MKKSLFKIPVYFVLQASYPTVVKSTPLIYSNYCLVQANSQFCLCLFSSAQHLAVRSHQGMMEPYIL